MHIILCTFNKKSIRVTSLQLALIHGLFGYSLTRYVMSYQTMPFLCLFRFISDWSNFTSCLSANGATFDDMHKYLSTYRFSDYYYNGSIASYYFFCTHLKGKSA